MGLSRRRVCCTAPPGQFPASGPEHCEHIPAGGVGKVFQVDRLILLIQAQIERLGDF